MPEQTENSPGVQENPQETSAEASTPSAAATGNGSEAIQDAQARTDAALREALEKAKAHEDAWLRALADAENLRKRTQAEIANAHKYALEDFASQLLPVKDSLEAALAAQNANLEAVRSGVELTLKQLVAVFEKSNLTEVDPLGQKFDPHRHQAISMVPSDKEPNTVVNVLQKGYLLHDRVIRPALVMVAGSRGD
ncbi:MAG: nucleotide exchange factor GrpE [Burkholderiales bacterium]|nr:nucleotide exchange factor GrpE [Burkholderiales bacterium]